MVGESLQDHGVGVAVLGASTPAEVVGEPKRLGVDAWAASARDAATILAAWRLRPPAIRRAPTRLDPDATRLATQADALGGAGLDGLLARFPLMADYDDRQLTRTRKDLVFIVQYLAAAALAADPAIFTDFLPWLQPARPPQRPGASIDHRARSPPPAHRGDRCRRGGTARRRTPRSRWRPALRASLPGASDSSQTIRRSPDGQESARAMVVVTCPDCPAVH
jgi:hypothetical protein